MIHSLKVQLSDYGLLESNPNDETRIYAANTNGTYMDEDKYSDFSKMKDGLNEELWTPSVRMKQYVPSKEVESWWRLFAETLPPNSFSGSAGFGSPCIFAKDTAVCPTKRLEKFEAFEDFEDAMLSNDWGELQSITNEEFRPNEFIGFDRLKVELTNRYGGEKWKKEDFEKEVHKRMRIELQKQIDAKEGFQIDAS